MTVCKIHCLLTKHITLFIVVDVIRLTICIYKWLIYRANHHSNLMCWTGHVILLCCERIQLTLYIYIK